MNAKQQQKEQFILLRADGVSLQKICDEISISKPTAVKWSRLYQDDINDLIFTSMMQIKQDFLQSKRERYKRLLKHLSKIDEAIEDMELSNTNIKDLWLIRNDIAEQVERMEKQTAYTNTNLVQKNLLGESEPVKVALNEV